MAASIQAGKTENLPYIEAVKSELADLDKRLQRAQAVSSIFTPTPESIKQQKAEIESLEGAKVRVVADLMKGRYVTESDLQAAGVVLPDTMRERVEREITRRKKLEESLERRAMSNRFS
jgi:hypothetical protein